MKYITITSKHHDGFAMFDSKVSDYNIVSRTPYRKDVLKALADECRKQGLKLFFYYSQLDWHHPDYFPLGRTGRDAERPERGDGAYIEYMNGQLRELLTHYGEIGGIWFDGWWDRPDASWHLDTTYSLIHQIQPQALIGANHHRRPFPGEDFQMFEKDLPGGRTADFNKDSEIGDLPLETCETMNGSWGFNITDRRTNPRAISSAIWRAPPDRTRISCSTSARCRTAASSRNSQRGCGKSGVDGEERPGHLWDARRSDRAAALGRDNAQRQ